MIYSDVYATMAVAARETRRIRLATGVAVPTTRIAPVIAHSIATVAELAPGRVELGVGNGNTARLTMGLKPVPLARMKREIRLIRTLLAGEVGLHEYGGESHPVQLLHRDHGFINLAHKIPITLSAFGPKTLAYCGAECDAHLTWAASPAALTDARRQIGAAAAAAGRDPESIPSKGIFPLAVLRPGETSASPRVIESLAPFITNFLHVQMEWDDKLLPPIPALAEVIGRYRDHVAEVPTERRHLVLHEGHLVYVRPEEREFLCAELAEAVAMVAEPDDMIDRIRALEAAGLKHFAFQVTDDPVGQLRYFADNVMRRYH
jgi:alkanesulfonate monooxygenase SsuD/methylene tetrahydromethanopterin reductase-like flavin-dependent oxidoreductase (luciferase family)